MKWILCCSIPLCKGPRLNFSPPNLIREMLLSKRDQTFRQPQTGFKQSIFLALGIFDTVLFPPDVYYFISIQRYPIPSTYCTTVDDGTRWFKTQNSSSPICRPLVLCVEILSLQLNIYFNLVLKCLSLRWSVFTILDFRFFKAKTRYLQYILFSPLVKVEYFSLVWIH